MKRRTHETHIPLTGMQILGILLMVAGFALLFGFGLRAYRYVTSDPDDALAAYQEELDAGIDPEAIRSEIRLHNRRKAAGCAPWIILGGILVIACPPMFYAPYADGIRIRWRRRKERAEEPEDVQFTDEEFDYPDDDFDFIIDENVRAQLIREREERIRNKRRRK